MFAIYRCLYGEDFIQQSINSIIDYVDKILIVWDNKVWGDVQGCNYKGQFIKYPDKFDNILEKIKELQSNKIILHYDHVFSPFGQHEHIIKNILPIYGNPEELMIIEVDQVFRKDQLEKALNEFNSIDCSKLITKQIEIWKMNYRVPERIRPGVEFIKKDDKKPIYWSDTYVHNMGFSFSDKIMYWKHLTALGFSSIIKDSLPNENWYEEKWLKWDFYTNNNDLEISKGCEKNIPYVIPYLKEELPESIKISL